MKIDDFHTDEEISKINLKNRSLAYIADWIVKNINPKYMLTLTYRFDVTEEQAEKTLEKWQVYMNRRLFPRGSGRYLKMIPFLETSSSGRYHWHILIEDLSDLKLKKNINTTKQDFRHWIAETWNKINVSGEFYRLNGKDWLADIAENDIEKVSRYVLKQNKNENTSLCPDLIRK